ncbi:MAG: hypothetical protein G01um101491_262, partial [Parcubacteria group bacterium Gr01-1014_91]
MSSLKHTERIKLEKLLEMSSGYVCDFSDRTFRDFILENTNVDVYISGYEEGGTSKANRLRTLLKKESDQISAKLIRALLDYWRTQRVISNTQITPNEEILFEESKKIADRLEGISFTSFPRDDGEMKKSLKLFLNDPRFVHRKLETIRESFPIEQSALRTLLLEVGAMRFQGGDGTELW